MGVMRVALLAYEGCLTSVVSGLVDAFALATVASRRLQPSAPEVTGKAVGEVCARYMGYRHYFRAADRGLVFGVVLAPEGRRPRPTALAVDDASVPNRGVRFKTRAMTRASPPSRC